MRPGSQFDRIKQNIKRLTSLRKNNIQPRIEAWTVLTQHNIKEAEDIVKLVKDLEMDCITFQSIMTDWGQNMMKDLINGIKVRSGQISLANVIENAKQLAKQLGIPCHLTCHEQADSIFTKTKPCHWPWQGAYIAANGDVVPCCIIANSEVVKMGNIFESDFKKIWNSPAYRSLRIRIKNHELPNYCKSCYGKI